MVDIGELVLGMRARFDRDVRPYLESNREVAIYGIMEILEILGPRRGELLHGVHLGWNYLESLGVLRHRLEEGRPYANDLKVYDAFARQTDLPL